MSKPVTQDERDEIVALATQGLTQREIARKTGRSISTVRRALAAAKITEPTQPCLDSSDPRVTVVTRKPPPPVMTTGRVATPYRPDFSQNYVPARPHTPRAGSQDFLRIKSK